MQQSSKASDRTLGDWFNYVQMGQVKLPRFQRLEAWDRKSVTSFLNTIINNLPVGVTLVLDVAGKEKFESRYISTADPTSPGAVTQHLLDGQQRLTAFWRTMHNNYEWETYFIYFPQFDRGGARLEAEIEIRCVPRWLNKAGQPMPRWAEFPAQCLVRGLVPSSLLRPGDIAEQIKNWITVSTAAFEPFDDEPDAMAKFKVYTQMQKAIGDEITTLRERVKYFNLPYLSLPSDTSKDVALQVLINMNTNGEPLTLYDIVVAEVESIAGKSLRDLEAELQVKCEKAARYADLKEMILTTSALLQDKPPSIRGMVDMDKKTLLANWEKLVRGLRKMAAFIESQGVFDAARLPTNAVLSVIAAAYDLVPEDGDFAGKAERLLRRYLWSSFFTDRYDSSAPSKALADFKALTAVLRNQQFAEADAGTIPVLNRAETPLPDESSLIDAGWPKNAGIKARAIIAVTTFFGAMDFADNKQASFENVRQREYHHLFPDALLAEAGIQSYLALNCALITWKTNRSIGRKDPLEYLEERVKWADENIVEERLKTHLISYELLSKAHYKGLEGDELKKKLSADFNVFLHDRAKLVVSAMKQLVDGKTPTLSAMWDDHDAGASSTEVTAKNDGGDITISDLSSGALWPDWMHKAVNGDFEAVPANLDWKSARPFALFIDGYKILEGQEPLIEAMNQMRETAKLRGYSGQSAKSLWIALFAEQRNQYWSGCYDAPSAEEIKRLDALSLALSRSLHAATPVERAELVSLFEGSTAQDCKMPDSAEADT